MNSIVGLLAAPAALDLTAQTVRAASTPFKLLLEAAQNSQATAGASGDEPSAENGATLQQRVARQLQEMLESLGVAAGDRVTLRISASGDVLADGHPLANEIEAAINNDAELKADVTRLAEAEALFDSSPFFNDARLEVEVADAQSFAILNWR